MSRRISINDTVTPFKIPMKIILEWPSPNLVNPVTRTWLVPYAIVLQAVTTLLVAARLWARYTKRAGPFGVDDVLIIIAWAFGVAFTGLAIWGVLSGCFDRHLWDVLQSNVVRGGLIAWLEQVIFLISNCTTKISILLFHRRMVSKSYSKGLHLAIHIAIAFTVLWFLAFLLLLGLGCRPLKAAWEAVDITYNKPYKCIWRFVVDPLVGALSVFSDVYTLILPALVIRRLHIGKRQRTVLYGIFGCGLLVVGAGIARAVWFARLDTDPRRDISWVAYEIFIWGLLENQLAIICASAPALKVFFEKYLVDAIQKVRPTSFNAKILQSGSSKASKNRSRASKDYHRQSRNSPSPEIKVEKSFYIDVEYNDPDTPQGQSRSDLRIYMGENFDEALDQPGRAYHGDRTSRLGSRRGSYQ